MKCTVPKCGRQINGMTGLQELQKLRQHFAMAHKISLRPDEALEVRVDIESGREPNVLRAMLGTDRISSGK